MPVRVRSLEDRDGPHGSNSYVGTAIYTLGIVEATDASVW